MKLVIKTKNKMSKLTKEQVENIANGYLTQCFNNGVYGVYPSYLFQQYCMAVNYLEENY